MEYLLASLMFVHVIVPLMESGQFEQAVKFALALGKEHWSEFIKRYNKLVKKQKYKNIKVGDVLLHVVTFKDKLPTSAHVKWLFVTKITKRFMSYQVIESDSYSSNDMLHTRPVLAVTSLYKKPSKLACTPEDLSNGRLFIVKDSFPVFWSLRKIPSSDYNKFQAIQVR
jgi:hypothetical protein